MLYVTLLGENNITQEKKPHLRDHSDLVQILALLFPWTHRKIMTPSAKVCWEDKGHNMGSGHQNHGP